jgi:hypothetical protein
MSLKSLKYMYISVMLQATRGTYNQEGGTPNGTQKQQQHIRQGENDPIKSSYNQKSKLNNNDDVPQ